MDKPSKYAKTMAECAVTGVPFVTVNDRIYRKCYREDLIEFTNRCVKGASRDAKPISPEFMFMLAENENKPQVSEVFTQALKALNVDIRSFKFKNFQDEMKNYQENTPEF